MKKFTCEIQLFDEHGQKVGIENGKILKKLQPILKNQTYWGKWGRIVIEELSELRTLVIQADPRYQPQTLKSELSSIYSQHLIIEILYIKEVSE